jgi:hypothetical protein
MLRMAGQHELFTQLTVVHARPVTVDSALCARRPATWGEQGIPRVQNYCQH